MKQRIQTPSLLPILYVSCDGAYKKKRKDHAPEGVVFFLDFFKKSLQDVRTMKPCVKVGNKLIPRKNVEFIDIEECPLTGRDIITFEYKGKIHKSYLFI